MKGIETVLPFGQTGHGQDNRSLLRDEMKGIETRTLFCALSLRRRSSLLRDEMKGIETKQDAPMTNTDSKKVPCSEMR